LFAVDPHDGTINPDIRNNIPGLEKLRNADLLVLFTRLRDLPDEQMRSIVEYVESGRPIVALRTATHAFDLSSPTYERYGWKSKTWDGGFGRHILGETWISHHGQHGKEGTRGVVVETQKHHPILRGIADRAIFGPTDVYGVRLPMPSDCMPLLLGEVTKTLKPDSPAVEGRKNDPMMPIAWTRTKSSARYFTTTMGASQDFENEQLRRLLVNACFWALRMDDKIPDRAAVDLVGSFQPSPFAFKGFKKGVRPVDHALK
jgi:type 1 glutamine amidotransferase